MSSTELRRDVDRVHLAGLVGADAVLDAEHALDLALHRRAEAVRLGDDLDRLARVLRDVELAEPSNSTEFQPVRRQIEIHSRSGQWSRCNVTGTGTASARARHSAYRASGPIASPS